MTIRDTYYLTGSCSQYTLPRRFDSQSDRQAGEGYRKAFPRSLPPARERRGSFFWWQGWALVRPKPTANRLCIHVHREFNSPPCRQPFDPPCFKS
mgnify:CR=1 FL=1